MESKERKIKELPHLSSNVMKRYDQWNEIVGLCYEDLINCKLMWPSMAISWGTIPTEYRAPSSRLTSYHSIFYSSRTGKHLYLV